jgi:hypothetical protein
LLKLLQEQLSLLQSDYTLRNKIGVGLASHMNPAYLQSDNVGLRLSLQERGQIRSLTQLPSGLFSGFQKVGLIDIVVSN